MGTEPLILASASPRRRELLALLGLPFEVQPSGFEEPSPVSHPNPAAFAQSLALGKANDVAARNPGRWVIGADTLVVLGTQLLAKPVDREDAASMIRTLSGHTHQVVTGVALVRHSADGGSEQSFHASTDVTFRSLEEAEIRAYVATGEPMDKAGAYGIQGHGALLIEGISGDFPNVVGLPVAPLALALRKLGYPILGA
jgi:septum formation protein